jgi:hypothetical protein
VTHSCRRVRSQVKFIPKITVKRDATNWKGRFETGPVTEAGKSLKRLLPDSFSFQFISIVFMYILVGKSLLVEMNLFLSVKFTLVGKLLLRKQPPLPTGDDSARGERF